MMRFVCNILWQQPGIHRHAITNEYQLELRMVYQARISRGRPMVGQSWTPAMVVMVHVMSTEVRTPWLKKPPMERGRKSMLAACARVL